MSVPIPDENIVAEIRMPDCDGNVCLTFVLDRQGNVRCRPEFGDPVRVEPVMLEAVAIAIAHLYELCPRFPLGKEEPGKTFEELIHGR